MRKALDVAVLFDFFVKIKYNQIINFSEMLLMKSVLFFIESLSHGGAEKIFATFIKKTKNTYDVFTETDGEIYTEIVRNNSHYRSMVHATGSVFGRLLNKIKIKASLVFSPDFVRRFFIGGSYDVEVAFCEGYSTKIIGNSKSKAKKIAWVHTDVVNNPWSEKIFGSAQEEKLCYEKFDAIVCVAQTMKDSFVKKYGMEEKIHVLYNPIDFDSVRKKGTESVDIKKGQGVNFVLAGSFVQVKGYSRFINVCERLKKDGYIFSVLIMGDGEEKEATKRTISEKKLCDTIAVLDFQTNPYKYIKNSDVFVCCSYAEGYSTAVSEAVVLGVPIITTECSGMREIFGNNECGIICENSVDGLYNAMKTVLDNPSILKRFGEEELIRANDFSLEKRVKEIENFIESI